MQILWRHSTRAYFYTNEPGGWLGYIWSLITDSNPNVEPWAHSYAPTTVTLASLSNLWFPNGVWGERLGGSEMTSLKATIENCGRYYHWAVERVNGREQYLWREEDREAEEEVEEEAAEEAEEEVREQAEEEAEEEVEDGSEDELEDETLDESEQGSDARMESSVSEELWQTISEPTTAEVMTAMLPELEQVQGGQLLSEATSGTQGSFGNGGEQVTTGRPQEMAEVDQSVTGPTTTEVMTALISELRQVGGEQASSKPTSSIQESSGNGQEQCVAGEPQEMPGSITVQANGSDTETEVDVEKSQDGRLAWLLEAGRWWFRWHDYFLAVLVVLAFLWPCHSEYPES